jgi:DNA-binding phage protein
MRNIIGKLTSAVRRKVKNMPPLTRDFKETILERAQKDPAFRIGLLTEAAQCLLNNETGVAKTLLRDYVNATLGFQALGGIVDKKPSSLMRMLSDKGNPTIDNMSEVLAAVQRHEGIEFNVGTS